MDFFFKVMIEEHLRREIPDSKVWGLYKLEKLIANKDSSYSSDAYNVYSDLIKNECLSLLIYRYLIEGLDIPFI